MSQTQNQYALITGATSGIGKELAKIFANNNFNLVIVSRSQDDLEATAAELSSDHGVQVISIAKDLFEENSATELYNEVIAKGITINVLVNDAGQGVYAKLWESDLERQLKIIHLNVISLTTLTYRFLKDMVSRNEGKILQLGSVVSEIPAPYQSVYGGTKAYVLSFTEAIRSELKDSKSDVTITVLQPGATDTDFFAKAGAEHSKMVEDESALSDPAQVAKDGFEALMKGDDKVVSGLKNKAQIAMANVIPDTMLADQMLKQSEPQNK